MKKERNELKLKKQKKGFLKKIVGMFENRKKRYLMLFLFILPLLIAIGVFGFIAYREVNNLISLATNSGEVKEEFNVASMDYALRDNATDYQKDCFRELKDAIEVTPTSDEVIAGMICKNFVADFYTWSNKQGQYDVGGMQYIYTGKQENTTSIKVLSYQKARDTFYKYLNNYINTYGSENLLEVENVEVVSAAKGPYTYNLNELTGASGNETVGWTAIYEDIKYDTYLVTCTWTYKENEVFDSSRYAKKANFAVIIREGRYEIVEVSEGTIDVKQVEEVETAETDETVDTVEE